MEGGVADLTAKKVQGLHHDVKVVVHNYYFHGHIISRALEPPRLLSLIHI